MADSEKKNKIDRRDFIRWVLISAGVSVAGGGAYLFGKRINLDNPQTIESLRDEFADIENSVRIIAEKYREMSPDNLSETDLLKEINQKLSCDKNDQDLFTDLRDLIQKQIQRDYLNSDFVEIEGWMLSKTEVQLCAIFSS